MIETIDLVIRSACVGICALMAIHFISIRPVSRKTVSTIVFLVSASGMIIATSLLSMQFGQQSATWALVSTIMISTSPVFIAWGLLELFEDNLKIQPWQIGFVTFSVATHFMGGIHPVFDTICHVTSLMIYGYLFYITITTRKHDLVMARCLFRLWFMGGAALAGFSFTALHWYFGDFGLPDWYYVFKASVLLTLTIIFAYWALKVREHVWALPQNFAMKRPETLVPAEVALLTKLQASMKEDVWREEGLTIRKLAENLDAPEHRLRKVINQGLGYRNFAAFVNEHRIGAACEVLADPVKADIPVITIAYEVGYASLGPFNRAFKDIVGESPTEYRKRLFSPA